MCSPRRARCADGHYLFGGVFTEASVGCRNKSDDVKIAAFQVRSRDEKIAVPADVQRKVDLTKDATALTSVASL